MDVTSSDPSKTEKQAFSIILHTYYRSSCSWRVRIALTYKEILYESKYVHLLKKEQHASDYVQLNPSHFVPTLFIDDHILNQSMAILEYLEETRPQFPLLPDCPKDRAIVRAMAQTIACDIQPIQNLRVLEHFSSNWQDPELKEAKKIAWAQHWIHLGLDSLESQVRQHSTSFCYCFKDKLSMVDCCFVPQMYNAIRFQMDLSPFPKLSLIYQHLMSLELFQKTSPEAQYDCPKR